MTSYRSSTRAGRALAACFLVVTLVGCGVRVGAPPAPIPSPDSTEQHRQEAAVALERVINAAGKDQGADISDALVNAARTYLEDLGGVWIPPPRDEDPSPTSPGSTGVGPDLATTLAESSAVLLARATAPDAQNPDALISMWLTLRTGSAALAEESAPCSTPCGGRVIPPALLDALSSGEQENAASMLLALVHTEAPDLIGIYDALGYIEEIRAARSSTDSRDEVARGARELRRFADLLAGEAGGTETDTRRSAYRFDTGDLDASSLRYLDAATAQWLALIAQAPPGAVDLVVDALWHTYASANPDLKIELWPGLGH